MRNALLFAILLVSFVLPASAAVVYKNFAESQDFSYYVPCANGGQGEMVRFTGSVVTRLGSTTANGLEIGYFHITPMLAGIGEISGVTYRVVGSNQQTFKLNPLVTMTGTFVYNFAALGSDHSMFHLHENFNYTFRYSVDSTGHVTITDAIFTHDNLFAFCAL